MAMYDDSPADEIQSDGDTMWQRYSQPRRHTIDEHARMLGIAVGKAVMVKADADSLRAGQAGEITMFDRFDGFNQAWLRFSDGNGAWLRFGEIEIGPQR